jgi:multidrug efflux pump subunit AcrA (membrane-fusion protein)
LERALDEARRGEERTPSDPAPKELTPYLSFQKLNAPALTAILRVLDTDDDFRQRVLAATPPESVNALSWLVLTRPPGWQDVVRAAAEGRDEQAGTQEAERRLRDLQRQLEAAERKRVHAEAELARRRDEVEAATEELSAVRRDRRQNEEAVRSAERRTEDLEQKLADRDARVAEAQGAREAREHELAETGRLLAEARAEVARRPAHLLPGERPVDVAALRQAADRLQRSTATLAKSVDGILAAVPPEPVDLDGAEAAPAPRTPLTLPGGVVADTVEGARWLLGQPGVVVLVDGYNVAKTAWPDVELEEQRTRLLRVLDELMARTGAPAEVVFDGPDAPAPAGRQTTPSVNVRYSGGELADDVVVALVGTFPVQRPVVVVSNDLEGLDGARREGANVIGSTTLIGLFGG